MNCHYSYSIYSSIFKYPTPSTTLDQHSWFTVVKLPPPPWQRDGTVCILWLFLGGSILMHTLTGHTSAQPCRKETHYWILCECSWNTNFIVLAPPSVRHSDLQLFKHPHTVQWNLSDVTACHLETPMVYVRFTLRIKTHIMVACYDYENTLHHAITVGCAIKCKL